MELSLELSLEWSREPQWSPVPPVRGPAGACHQLCNNILLSGNRSTSAGNLNGRFSRKLFSNSCPTYPGNNSLLLGILLLGSQHHLHSLVLQWLPELQWSPVLAWQGCSRTCHRLCNNIRLSSYYNTAACTLHCRCSQKLSSHDCPPCPGNNSFLLGILHLCKFVCQHHLQWSPVLQWLPEPQWSPVLPFGKSLQQGTKF